MASRYRLNLLEEVTVDGDGDIVIWDSLGPGAYQVFGTWDGATVTLYWSTNGTNWEVVEAATFTADGGTTIEGGNVEIKATISNAGASTSLTAYAVPQATHTDIN